MFVYLVDAFEGDTSEVGPFIDVRVVSNVLTGLTHTGENVAIVSMSTRGRFVGFWLDQEGRYWTGFEVQA